MRRGLVIAGAVVAVLAGLGISGCGSLGYYGQSIHGHFSLLNSARPVPDWLADIRRWL